MCGRIYEEIQVKIQIIQCCNRCTIIIRSLNSELLTNFSFVKKFDF